LQRVDRILDLNRLRAEVAELYSGDNGRPGIDPEVTVRLMPAGFLLGIVHDRRLMREAQVNLAATNGRNRHLEPAIDAATTTTGRKPVTVTADAGYAYRQGYGDP
jgi:transposase